MERKVMAELVKWKDKTNRMPLILNGARQVGKTYILKAFGETCFEQRFLKATSRQQESSNIWKPLTAKRLQQEKRWLSLMKSKAASGH